MTHPISLSNRILLHKAAHQISSHDRSIRDKSVSVLKMHCELSIPLLERMLNRSRDHRRQFFAAAVLHKLGHPRGMQFLTGFLLWRLPTSAFIRSELEQAILEIGTPEAASALLDVWPSIPIHSDNIQIHVLICKICSKLKEIRVLETLSTNAHRFPFLFLKTTTEFGEASLPFIERMLRDQDPIRRKIGVKAAKGIHTPSFFNLLTPLLRDTSEEVREAVPIALIEIQNTQETVEEIACAIVEGWSSIASVQTIALDHKSPDNLISPIISRWPLAEDAQHGDTQETVLYILNHLTEICPGSTEMKDVVCKLLERDIDPEIAHAAITFLAGEKLDDSFRKERAVKALTPWLSSINPIVRAVTAEALSSCGSDSGVIHEALLKSRTPSESVLHKFQVLLHSVYSETTIGQNTPRLLPFFNQNSYRPPGWNDIAASNHPSIIVSSEQLELLMRLLKNVYEEMKSHSKKRNIPDILATGVAVMRALGDVEILQKQKVCRTLQSIIMHPDMILQSESGQEKHGNYYREVTTVLRAESAATLAQISRDAAFVTYIQAACDTKYEVKLTGVAALGYIGDVRAIAVLIPILSDSDENLQLCVKSAIRLIQEQNPDMLTLLRASQTPIAAETLLRQVETAIEIDSNELLRHSDI